MSKKGLFGAAIALGAGAAIYATLREKETRPQRPEKASPALSPISSLVSRQKNLDKIDCAAIRKWFLDETGGNTGGKTLLIMKLSETALNGVGYYLDTPLDQAYYLLGIISDNNSSQQLTHSLFNFSEIEPALHDLLEKGHGIIKVSGNRRGTADSGVIGVDRLDFPTLKNLTLDRLEADDGDSREM